MRYVIYHQELGVYLGNCMGMGFWSNLDAVGQDCAVTFASEAEISQHISSWNEPLENCEAIPVEADDGIYATIDSCVSAGLPSWQLNPSMN